MILFESSGKSAEAGIKLLHEGTRETQNAGQKLSKQDEKHLSQLCTKTLLSTKFDSVRILTTPPTLLLLHESLLSLVKFVASVYYE